MILIVDDDYAVTASLGLLCKQAGWSTTSASTPEEALAALARPGVSLVLQDMNFSRETSGEEGLALLRRIRAQHPRVPVILITAWGSIQLAVDGMKEGAADFITKPWHNEQVLQSVRTALGLASRRQRRASHESLDRSALEREYDLTGIEGEHPRFLAALELALNVAGTEASILVTGETGTGKEVIASAVHRNSSRAGGAFVKVNLAGLPPGLFESELFGHVRGAFTDAARDRPGRFAAAQGGTILLDEIGDLDLSSQVKLLRVLQDRQYEVLGTDRAVPLESRVLAATNVDLEDAIRNGSFREDLYYRINLIRVHLPPLSERLSDIPLLAERFLEDAARSFARPARSLDRSAQAWLRERSWPGNVRQLQHLLTRAVLTSSGAVLTDEDLRRTQAMDFGAEKDDPLPAVGTMTLPEMERAMICKALAHHGGNLSRVAESLGMSRPALYRRLEKHGIEA
ncbi:MAG: sigma-54 dependent transcriptional regulator [Candidatus Eisenbacteria bacterium]|uniref:Sigma-54-dependent Fis family transcriptional regulator n=1 Tax=Eiseniibacteriota bacterium TaxID=2212470 RepID=A0A956LVY5_UNCEI|nr:sigma-54-dependent Fis family transcriptional regulator [Candidatus Eisenbacteria bacterium]